MDQALESKYNKPAKGTSGIIGITHRKAEVGKWNLIKGCARYIFASLFFKSKR